MEKFICTNRGFKTISFTKEGRLAYDRDAAAEADGSARRAEEVLVGSPKDSDRARQDRSTELDRARDEAPVASPDADLAKRRDEIGNDVRAILNAIEGAPENVDDLGDVLHELLANQPLAIVIDALQRSDLLPNVREKIVPHIMGKMAQYVTAKGYPQCANFVEQAGLNREEQFLLALLYLKNPAQAGEHTLDLLMVAEDAFSRVPSLRELDAERKGILRAAILRHDLGKADLPNIVYISPLRRQRREKNDVTHGDVYRRYLLSDDRGETGAPFEFSPAQSAEFDAFLKDPKAPLPEGISDKETLADMLIHACEQNNVDFRAEVPVGFLLQTSLELADDETINPHIQRALQAQKADLQKWPEILALYAQHSGSPLAMGDLSPDESFASALNRHEAGSLELVAGANASTIDAQGSDEDTVRAKYRLARVLHAMVHHGNPITMEVLKRLQITADNEPPRGDKVPHDAIRIIDIIAALSRTRSYKRAENGHFIQDVLTEEIEAGHVDALLGNEFLEHLLPGPTTPEKVAGVTASEVAAVRAPSTERITQFNVTRVFGKVRDEFSGAQLGLEKHLAREKVSPMLLAEAGRIIADALHEEGVLQNDDVETFVATLRARPLLFATIVDCTAPPESLTLFGASIQAVLDAMDSAKLQEHVAGFMADTGMAEDNYREAFDELREQLGGDSMMTEKNILDEESSTARSAAAHIITDVVARQGTAPGYTEHKHALRDSLKDNPDLLVELVNAIRENKIVKFAQLLESIAGLAASVAVAPTEKVPMNSNYMPVFEILKAQLGTDRSVTQETLLDGKSSTARSAAAHTVSETAANYVRELRDSPEAKHHLRDFLQAHPEVLVQMVTALRTGDFAQFSAAMDYAVTLTPVAAEGPHKAVFDVLAEQLKGKTGTALIDNIQRIASVAEGKRPITEPQSATIFVGAPRSALTNGAAIVAEAIQFGTNGKLHETTLPAAKAEQYLIRHPGVLVELLTSVQLRHTTQFEYLMRMILADS